jgi:hypothetical protein
VNLASRPFEMQETAMKTFVARFVRPSGLVGVIHIMASSSVCAMLHAMTQVSGATDMSVRPSRRAALLAQYPARALDGTASVRASAQEV